MMGMKWGEKFNKALMRGNIKDLWKGWDMWLSLWLRE